MSSTEGDLLIIYEAEAKQWATYLRAVFAGPIGDAGILCYDIAAATHHGDDLTRLSGYRCKLLVLSLELLEGLCQLQRVFLARVLHPAECVVVLLCGMDSLEPLLDTVPLGRGCLQVSSDQDAQEYLSVVTEILHRDRQTGRDPGQSPDTDRMTLKQPRVHSSDTPAVQVVPARVPCKSPGNVFILLRGVVAGMDAHVEFQQSKHRVTVSPVVLNEHTLQVHAPELPAGRVQVSVLFEGTPVNDKGQLQYYSPLDEVAQLLRKAADPVDFMCQAFHTSSVEMLDDILTSLLMERMPAGGFHGLQENKGDRAATRPEDLPTLLHFAAQHGLRGLASLLLQCPGAQLSLRAANRHGDTPLKLADRHGHTQLSVLLREALAESSKGEDSSIYEMMGSTGRTSKDHIVEEHTNQKKETDEEDPYVPLGGDDGEYDTILASSKAASIINRPPAPTPRPESSSTKDDNTPFIAQVFQKMSQAAANTLYSLPNKRGQPTSCLP